MNGQPPLPARRVSDQPNWLHPVAARDAGLELISRVNHWLVTIAVALTGLVSLVAYHAFHGRTLGTNASALTARGSAPQPQATGEQRSGGLQPPAQAPTSTPATPSPAVSGGS